MYITDGRPPWRATGLKRRRILFTLSVLATRPLLAATDRSARAHPSLSSPAAGASHASASAALPAAPRASLFAVLLPLGRGRVVRPPRQLLRAPAPAPHSLPPGAAAAGRLHLP